MIKAILVDDHELLRFGIKNAINSENDDVTIVGEAETGEEFFHLLSYTPADIVLLDINLPDMSGIDVAQRLKKENPELKILVITSENSMDVVKKLIDLGVEGFITKRTGAVAMISEAVKSIMEGFNYYGKDISDIIYRIYVSKRKSTLMMPELSAQEKKVIELCRDGIPSKQIADKLFISTRTVENHKNNIFRKLGIHSSIEMVQYAIRNGIIGMDF